MEVFIMTPVAGGVILKQNSHRSKLIHTFCMRQDTVHYLIMCSLPLDRYMHSKYCTSIFVIFVISSLSIGDDAEAISITGSVTRAA